MALVMGSLKLDLSSIAIAEAFAWLLEQMLKVRDLQRELNDRVILTSISFSISRGEILFVRGPSGVGKSLLLRALAYLDPIQVFTPHV